MMEINEENAKLLLAQIQEKLGNETVKYAERIKLQVQLHELAEFQYRPAIDLFVSGLSDSNSAWRYSHLTDLGFHYSVDDLRPYLGKLQALLLEDPDEDVRRAAATIVGRVSNWPDIALLHSLEKDPDETVRESSFEALLSQLGVQLPNLRILRYELKLRGNDVSLDALKEIAKQNGKHFDV